MTKEQEILKKHYELEGFTDIHLDEDTNELVGWFKNNGPAYYLPETKTAWEIKRKNEYR